MKSVHETAHTAGAAVYAAVFLSGPEVKSDAENLFLACLGASPTLRSTAPSHIQHCPLQAPGPTLIHSNETRGAAALFPGA